MYTSLFYIAAYAGDSLWTAVPPSGDVLRIDPGTNAVRQRIHLGDAATGRGPQSVVSDGMGYPGPVRGGGFVLLPSLLLFVAA